MTIFDINSPLPAAGQTIVLEASAGTGKTYTISYLVARYVASGVPLRSILAVTFTRRAAGELQDGIRERLQLAVHAFREAQAGGVPDPSFATWINTTDPATWPQIVTNLENGLSQIDAAPIYTIHTFAHTMLSWLGILADYDDAIDNRSDVSDLARQVADDTYLTQLHRGDVIDTEQVSPLGKLATESVFTDVVPHDSRDANFVRNVSNEFATRKRERRLIDYNDMITRLADSLADPVTGSCAAQVLSERFRVVLIDEFQDTDAHQWEFLSQAFHQRSALLLIGDPKQAIYSFRGGDVHTYLRARSEATTVARLGTNYRSDEVVVRGIESLFGYGTNVAAPGEQITLEKVDVSHAGWRLDVGEQPLGSVNIRAIAATKPTLLTTSNAWVQSDVLRHVTDLVSGVTINDDGTTRPVNHGDIAILVNTKYFGNALQSALSSAGHPAVFVGSTSVFSTDEALDWLTVVEALASNAPRDLRRAALTGLIGVEMTSIAASDAQFIAAIEGLTRASSLLRSHGVSVAFDHLLSIPGVIERLTSPGAPQESFMNYRHIAQLLADAQRREHLRPTGLVDYLRSAITQASVADEEAQTRRLPTDEPVIRIMTIHASKGSQFPIVLLPQVAIDAPHDPHRQVLRPDGVLDLDVSREAWLDARGQIRAENLRMLYVAMTRAESMVTAWWAPAQRWDAQAHKPAAATMRTALHRLLRRDRANPQIDDSYPLCSAQELQVPQGVTLTLVDPDHLTSNPAGAEPEVHRRTAVRPRRFVNHIDRTWVRTSYSGLTSDLPHDQVADEHHLDEPDVAIPVTDAVDDTRASALAALPGGALFGTLVHELFEAVDPSSPTLAADLHALLAERSALTAGIDHDLLIQGLIESMTTDLGVLTEGRTLANLGITRRLAELDFEIPLGGDTPRRVADLARLFSTLDPGDPVQAYGEFLGSTSAASTVLKGFLTGSVDAIYQIPTSGRFVVFDYKTNVIPTGDEPLLAHHYNASAMTTLMYQAHYPLQALLYCVALHRYLSWRQPHYDPSHHLGGVGYLFVRGMTGENNAVISGMPTGVFTWRPPAAMIIEASHILGGSDV